MAEMAHDQLDAQMKRSELFKNNSNLKARRTRITTYLEIDAERFEVSEYTTRSLQTACRSPNEWMQRREVFLPSIRHDNARGILVPRGGILVVGVGIHRRAGIMKRIRAQSARVQASVILAHTGRICGAGASSRERSDSIESVSRAPALWSFSPTGLKQSRATMKLLNRLAFGTACESVADQSPNSAQTELMGRRIDGDRVKTKLFSRDKR
ncbi:hypothetical protein C8R45DRAFT_1156651 [Mycena sanguinolenta]|nr:hypothetical protein C8R45DRAFT_1156651 [Mycena sanguinolenta]